MAVCHTQTDPAGALQSIYLKACVCKARISHLQLRLSEVSEHNRHFETGAFRAVDLLGRPYT